MSNHKYLGSTPFGELLPSSIAGDDTIRAVAETVDSVFAPSVGGIANLLLFARLMGGTATMLPPMQRLSTLNEVAGGLEPLSGELLDSLAWQYHVDAWDAAKDEDTKREMLLQSLLLHRRKGTPWAVHTALSIVLALPVTVREWFDYGGNPHFFRLAFDVSESGLDDAMLGRIAVTLEEQKNVRSWLDLLETASLRELPWRMGLACVTATQGGATFWMPPTEARELVCRTDLMTTGKTGATVTAFMPATDAPAHQRRTAAGLVMGSGTQLFFWGAPMAAPDTDRRTALTVMGKTHAAPRFWMSPLPAPAHAQGVALGLSMHSSALLHPWVEPFAAEALGKRTAMATVDKTASYVQFFMPPAASASCAGRIVLGLALHSNTALLTWATPTQASENRHNTLMTCMIHSTTMLLPCARS